MHSIDKDSSPYTRPAELSIFDKAKQEYAALIEQKRKRDGVGKDWNQQFHIEGVTPSVK